MRRKGVIKNLTVNGKDRGENDIRIHQIGGLQTDFSQPKNECRPSVSVHMLVSVLANCQEDSWQVLLEWTICPFVSIE